MASVKPLIKKDGNPVVPKGASHLCVFPSGWTDIYPHPTVTVIAFDKLGRLGLVRRRPDAPIEGGKIVLPGGHIQQGGTKQTRSPGCPSSPQTWTNRSCCPPAGHEHSFMIQGF